MRLNRFDLNLLLVLDALLELRNVTRAAEQLHISQSGASAALSRLREYFQDPLLEPVGRRLTLTPLAQGLVEPVREALLQVKSALARRPCFDPATAEHHFVVCASDYVVTVLLATVVQRLAHRAPGLSLSLRSPPRDIEQALDRGQIDLIVLPQQYAERMKHPQEPLFEDGHVCVAWKEHPRAAGPLTLDEYMALDHVTVRFGDDRSVSFEEWFLPRYGQQRRVSCSVDSFSALPMLLLGTKRLATVHRRLAEHAARALPLQLIELPFDMPALQEVLAWPHHRQLDPAHEWLREQIRECAHEL